MSFPRSSSHAAPQPARRSGRPRALALIAFYKLAKTVACLVLAALSLRLLQPRTEAGFGRWLASVASATHSGIVARTVEWLLGLGPHQFRLFAGIAVMYAVLYAVQGVGLWFERRWAGYLVVVETALLLPFEFHEQLRRHATFTLLVLVVNIAVLVYLVALLRRHSGAGRWSA